MNNRRVSIGGIIFSILIIIFTIYMCLIFEPVKKTINNYYQVYLGGKKIGLIKSEDELYNLIDTEQKDIKEKYNVKNVYSPSGLEVHKVSTYNTNTLTAREVYNEIKDIDPFTIEGYEITIKYEDNQRKKVYILDKELLDSAVKNTVLAFVDEDDYNAYLKGEKVVNEDEEGREITDIYFDSEVSLKKAYISTEEEIITDSNTLSKYFLFGTTNLEKKYKVKESDTLDSIAYNNKLGVEDLLIANPEIGGENALLAIGQEVNVAPINPLSNIVVESFDTELTTVSYETKAEFDSSLNSDESYVKQQGSDGLSKVVYATKEMNGVILNTSLVSEEVLKEVVDKIVVYGAKNVVYYGTSTYWAWPTTKPFRISSNYGYRNHPIKGLYHFHPALDITGTSSKDIYSIQKGTVTKAVSSGYNSGAGKYVTIDHGNGYVSTYMHLSKVSVKVGQEVVKGQIIGVMGCTGSCTGTHLDFRVQKNGDYMNPFNLYK